jgi:hypothetical protein
VLQICEPLVEAAKGVVSAYDALDWPEIERADLNEVSLEFATTEGRRRAESLILQIASANSRAREKAIRAFGGRRMVFKALRHFLGDIHEWIHTQPQEAGRQPLEAEVERSREHLHDLECDFQRRLEQWASAVEPADASQLDSFWKALNRILAELEEMRARAIKIKGPVSQTIVSSRAVPPRLLIPIQPVRVGDPAADWLTLPLPLFLGEEIVGFCRELSRVNTPLRQRSVARHRVQRARQYEELLNRCQLASITILREDEGPNPPLLPRVQHQTEVVVSALNRFFKQLLREGRSRRISKRNKQRSPHQSREARPKPADLPSPQHPRFEVLIENVTTIQVKAPTEAVWEPVKSKPLMEALLALALLDKTANPGAISFKYGDLINPIYSGVEPRKKWYVFKKALTRRFAGLGVDNSVRGAATVCGLYFDTRVRDDQIRCYFKPNSPFGRAQANSM